ncbi:DegV domain-containing protein [Clostridium acetireducens DSM 10703]|jgi:DegV family protein with EDD domain|uniref:DegV domain-containing protein n=1 Tax=Clostridium acetireducens DSM 10703 TaxID=1121290 RepID=A0A1E8EWU0_9CLOT|nr:DegV family protein [Clostridium acetireducens]OFI05070.1 DegV domain-containing protein [Clostridium acetireducens DSM 10703]
MDKIKIVTDSTADLPKEVVEKYNIDVLRLLVNFGQETYTDGLDINLKQLLNKMENSNIFPTTTQFNPQKFVQCYKKYLSEGYKILSIHLSSKMSGTYQSACIAKSMLQTDDIVVIDSQNVTSGLGLLVMKACRLREEGLSIKEIEKEILNTIPHVKSVLAFETLDNLVKGGRLSKTAGIIGNILGIKPILTVEDGEMKVKNKVRGSKKAVRLIVDTLEKLKTNGKEPIVLLHVENKDILEILRNKLDENNNYFIECEVGCVVGVHAGPRACGVFFIEDY